MTEDNDLPRPKNLYTDVLNKEKNIPNGSKWLQTIRIILVLIAALFVSGKNALAQDTVSVEQRFSEVEISLLTCGPGNDVSTLYGHTAIRIVDRVTKDDFVVNYGVYNTEQKNFVWHFVLGETDYEVGLYPTDIFCKEYESEGRYVKEQVLNLTPKEKQQICRNIAENAQYDNRVYRYNIFYNNCTTKARDVIINNLEGNVEFQTAKDDVSFREMTHFYSSTHRWTQFGNDILLGYKADKSTELSDQQFLPERLMNSFDHATIGNKPLVKATNMLVMAGGNMQAKDGFPLSPTVVALIIAAIIVITTIIERYKHFYCAPLDVALMALCGLIGVLLTLMWFSEHPTVNINFQWFLFCPLLLLFGFQAVKARKKGDRHWLWSAWMTAIVVLLICRLFQNYAEGVMILALSLLIRIIFTHQLVKRKKQI